MTCQEFEAVCEKFPDECTRAERNAAQVHYLTCERCRAKQDQIWEEAKLGVAEAVLELARRR